MKGEVDLERLLILMQPKLLPGEYVFCSLPGSRYGDYGELEPVACYLEEEGLSLLLPKESALAVGLSFESVFKGIALSVHSSLEAVGLTAAVSTRLAARGICANMVAAFYHDYVFVQAERAEEALKLLSAMADGEARDEAQDATQDATNDSTNDPTNDFTRDET